ncbi:uncharacterized protein RSE6_04626 [Rhynchosporium secalis]|uniref:Uncharacterized protein n=1 Tax=Rhynchosporium secalis TaxID=38038 RepID=A0A1E1M5S7_RHYSE|nr:uncharacterized protein RSE6_04626 [Rhynchosporium secalis]
MLSNILLSVWDLPKAALLFSYYISYAGAATTPVLIVSDEKLLREIEMETYSFVQAWGNELNAGDPNRRQLIVATSNIVSYAWVFWVPLFLFPTYDAPKYKYGYQVLIPFGGLAIMGTTLMPWVYRRSAKGGSTA